MPKLTLEVVGESDKIRLARTRMEWLPDSVQRASESDWPGARTDVLLAFFTQYKLWDVRRQVDPTSSVFEIRGGSGELAARLHHLLDNSHRSGHGGPHWVQRVFGHVPGQPGRCRLEQLIEVPERSGEYIVRIVRDDFTPDHVTLIWNGQEVRAENQLDTLLNAIGFPSSQYDTLSCDDADLTGSIGVRVWSSSDSRRRGLCMSQPGVLCTGECIRIEAKVSRAAFLYLIWINSGGVAKPIYPWKPGHWDERPTREQRVTHLDLPKYRSNAEYAGWPIEPPQGIETLVLMASDRKLSRSFDLQGKLSDFPPRTIEIDPRHLTTFECRGSECLREVDRLPLGLDTLVPIDDPVLQTYALLRDRLGVYFLLIKAVSFVTRIGHTNDE